MVSSWISIPLHYPQRSLILLPCLSRLFLAWQFPEAFPSQIFKLQHFSWWISRKWSCRHSILRSLWNPHILFSSWKWLAQPIVSFWLREHGEIVSRANLWGPQILKSEERNLLVSSCKDSRSRYHCFHCCMPQNQKASCFAPYLLADSLQFVPWWSSFSFLSDKRILTIIKCRYGQ